MANVKPKYKIKKLTRGDIAFAAVVLAIMILFAASYIFMFVWVFLNSFRVVSNYNANPMNMFDFTGVGLSNMFDNYKEVFEYTVQYTAIIAGKRQHVTIGILDMFGNSLVQIVIAVGCGLVFPPVVGYIISKYEFKGKRIIEFAVVMTMCIPTIGTTASVISFYDKLGIMNTWWTVLLSRSGGLGFGVLLYGNYFGAIPREYVESAKLDGAGNLRAYLSIMLPQALPILTAQGILTFISNWNDYMTSFLYLRYNPTIAYGINALSNQFSNAYPVVFSALFMTSAVTLIMFGCFNKKIMSSMSAGGLKG